MQGPGSPCRLGLDFPLKAIPHSSIRAATGSEMERTKSRYRIADRNASGQGQSATHDRHRLSLHFPGNLSPT